MHIVCILLMLTAGEAAYAATPAPVEVGPIQVFPAEPVTGQHPRITVHVLRTALESPQEPVVVNVIAVVVLPDNTMKSWVWNKVSLTRNESKEFSLPAVYDIKQAGKYKIEFNVYSADMRRRFAAHSTTFSVVLPSLPVERKAPARLEAPPRRRAPERDHFGVGIYGNALNPAGGATIMLWPFQNVGLQGTYTVGIFTSYEARLLVKFYSSPRFKTYIGAGYLSVSKESDVIGVNTEFKNSGVSAVAGVEVPLGRRVYGYLEVSGAKIDLQETVTNGAQTVEASVKYAPVTIGAGIVFYLF